MSNHCSHRQLLDIFCHQPFDFGIAPRHVMNADELISISLCHRSSKMLLILPPAGMSLMHTHQRDSGSLFQIHWSVDLIWVKSHNTQRPQAKEETLIEILLHSSSCWKVDYWGAVEYKGFLLHSTHSKIGNEGLHCETLPAKSTVELSNWLETLAKFHSVQHSPMVWYIHPLGWYLVCEALVMSWD